MRRLAAAIALLGAGASLAVAVGAGAAQRPQRHRSRESVRVLRHRSFAPAAARAPQRSLAGLVTTVPAGQGPADPAADPGTDPATTTPTTTTGPTTTPGSPPPTGPARVGVTENDQGALTLKTSRTGAPAGAVTFVVANAGADPHDFSIDDAAGHTITRTLIDSRHGANVAVTLAPGTYRLYCSLFTHAANGMQRSFTVTAPSG